MPTKRAIVVTCLLTAISSQLGICQLREDRLSVGINGGVNLMLSDFGTKKFGPGGELILRYGFAPRFSVGLLSGYGELKAEQVPPPPGIIYNYMKLHTIPAAVVGWWHLSPGEDVSPYIYGGIGLISYKQRDGQGREIPRQDFQVDPFVPVGVGLETSLSKNVSLGFDFGLRVTTTDFLEGVTKNLPDSYVTARIGLNFYFGAPKTVEREIIREYKPAPVEVRKDTLVIVHKDTVVRRDTLVVLERGKRLVLEGVTFAFNSAELTQEAERRLESAYATLVANSDVDVEIVGHTDNIGTKEYNDYLSLRRAEAVRTWLVNRGTQPSRLSMSGRGFAEPIAPNTTPEGRAKNRRIEFRVK
jgi:outer membrane protein OmpA-like peptidoglycan-associated protein